MRGRSESRTDLVLAELGSLEDAIDRDALAAVCRSFFALFGLSVRIVGESGQLLADVHEEAAICTYARTFPKGRAACDALTTELKHIDPGRESLVHPCFTGAVYRIEPVAYQGRAIGRLILGPYRRPDDERARAEREGAPIARLLERVPELDRAEAKARLRQMPVVREDTAARISAHLAVMVQHLAFASHRALLASEMHIASVRESHRELVAQKEDLEAAYARLQEADQLKSNFLSTVSHELRTPLTSIIGYAEMLRTEMLGPLDGELRECAQTIQQRGEHLLQLISRLLDVGRLERGHVLLERTWLDPAAAVQTVVEDIEPLAAKRDVSLALELDQPLPTLHADPIRLRQILLNLIENAVKFSHDGGTVTIRVEAATIEKLPREGLAAALFGPPTQALRFRVIDNGVGIPASAITKVFEPFFQAESGSTRRYGGAGLGLAIVSGLVEAHGGHITVQSAPDVKTEFCVTLPLERPDE